MANTLVGVNAGQLSSGTLYREWIKKIQQVFDEIGLTRTSDTGQVDSDTVTYPGGSSFPHVSEIRKFPTSTTQTNAPYFFKIHYGTSNARGRFTITVGTGSDGLGDLTAPPGFIVGSDVISGGLTTDYSASVYAASDGHGFALYMTRSAFADAGDILFVFDRHRDSSGLPLETGATMIRDRNSSSSIISVLDNRCWYDNVSGTSAAATSVIPPVVTPGTLSNSESMANTLGQTQIYPWWGVANNTRGPLKMLATYNVADLGTLTEEEVNFLGSERIYRPLGTRFGPVSSSRSVSTSYDDGAGTMIWWTDDT